MLAWLAPQLGEVALLFGAADYCALMLLGFFCVSIVTTGSLLNGPMCLSACCSGRSAPTSSPVSCATPSICPSLSDGVGLVSIALGCFGIAEITKNLDEKSERTPFNGEIT